MTAHLSHARAGQLSRPGRQVGSPRGDPFQFICAVPTCKTFIVSLLPTRLPTQCGHSRLSVSYISIRYTAYTGRRRCVRSVSIRAQRATTLGRNDRPSQRSGERRLAQRRNHQAPSAPQSATRLPCWTRPCPLARLDRRDAAVPLRRASTPPPRRQEARGVPGRTRCGLSFGWRQCRPAAAAPHQSQHCSRR